jgi:hypothetical protein
MMPDLGKVTDGYWLQWMRFGLSEFASNNGCPKLILADAYKLRGPLQSQEDEEIEAKIFREILEVFGNKLLTDRVLVIPKFFDRIVGHIGVQFSTSVKNLLTVNFLAKIKRVCKYEVQQHSKIEGYSGFDLLMAVCNSTNKKETPLQLQSFVYDVREALGLKGKDFVVIDENTAFDMPTRFNAHWFLQKRLDVFERKKLMLAPVYKVQRVHIRLDATHLFLLCKDFLNDEAMQSIDHLKPSKEVPQYVPNKKEYPIPDEYFKAKKEYDELKAQKAVYVKKKKEIRMESAYAKIEAKKCENPETLLMKEIPIPAIKKNADLNKNDPAWKELRAKLEKQKDDAMNERSKLRNSQEFQEKMKKYEEYEDSVNAFGLSLFADFKDRNPKLGWKPSGSIMTDGTSLCVTYERTVTKENKSCAQKEKELQDEKTAKKNAAKRLLDLAPFDEYDPKLSTCFQDILVLGVDPGRVCLVTIVCIDPNGKKTTWRLSRSQFYHDSGIFKQNCRQFRRLKPFKLDFEKMTLTGGALRTSSSNDIVEYVKQYKTFQDKWYNDFAFTPQESKAKMSRFIGKQKTLAKFFTKVRTEAENIKKEHKLDKIEVAYGACGPTMAASGRGELSVPTNGTFQACVKAFTTDLTKKKKQQKNVVSLENEDYTSQVSWDTKRKYEIVYKTFDSSNKEYLQHTPSKYAPYAKGEEIPIVERKIAERREKRKHQRRGGISPTTEVPLAPIASADAKDAQKIRHVEVRGLLFCPEKRMYFDRDESSARAIAGLRCIKLQGLGRPTAFRRPVNPTPKTAKIVNGSSRSETDKDATIFQNTLQGNSRLSTRSKVKKPAIIC